MGVTDRLGVGRQRPPQSLGRHTFFQLARTVAWAALPARISQDGPDLVDGNEVIDPERQRKTLLSMVMEVIKCGDC